ncbi:MAG: hypothetical protein ACM3XZ_06100 [Betaproteobacteria bacterium]
MKKASATLALSLSLFLPAQVLACYGAAALGMGGAYTSVAKGVLAIYWNQAGLAFTDGQGEASLTVSSPPGYTNYQSFAGIAAATQEGLGIGFGQTEAEQLWGHETWNTFAVGVRLADEFAVGGALRQVEGTARGTSLPYTSTGMDFSAQYRGRLGEDRCLNLGLLVQDVGGPSDTNLYGQNIRPSISLETDKVTLGFDLYNAAELEAYQLGLEVRPQGKQGPFALRSGVYHDVVTVGGGIKVKDLFVDVVAMPEWEVVQFTGGVRF